MVVASSAEAPAAMPGLSVIKELGDESSQSTLESAYLDKLTVVGVGISV